MVYVVSASFSDPEALLAGKVVLFPKGFNLNAYRYAFKSDDIIEEVSTEVPVEDTVDAPTEEVVVENDFAASKDDDKEEDEDKTWAKFVIPAETNLVYMYQMKVEDFEKEIEKLEEESSKK